MPSDKKKNDFLNLPGKTKKITKNFAKDNRENITDVFRQGDTQRRIANSIRDIFGLEPLDSPTQKKKRR